MAARGLNLSTEQKVMILDFLSSNSSEDEEIVYMKYYKQSIPKNKRYIEQIQQYSDKIVRT